MANDLNTLLNPQFVHSLHWEKVSPADHQRDDQSEAKCQQLGSEEVKITKVLGAVDLHHVLRVHEHHTVERTPNDWQDVDLAIFHWVIDLELSEYGARNQIESS